MSDNTMEKCSVQLPRWKCHKVVYADKIVRISSFLFDVRWELECGGIVHGDDIAELTKRGSPIVGDYFVHYEDGYKSWSPAKVFEAGYTRIT